MQCWLLSAWRDLMVSKILLMTSSSFQHLQLRTCQMCAQHTAPVPHKVQYRTPSSVIKAAEYLASLPFHLRFRMNMLFVVHAEVFAELTACSSAHVASLCCNVIAQPGIPRSHLMSQDRQNRGSGKNLLRLSSDCV